jgi:Flp pilus assembly protein TadG
MTETVGRVGGACRQRHTVYGRARSGGCGVRRAPERGAAAVEFALLLPVLMALFMGSLEIGLILYDKAVLTNASREGARAGIVLRSPKPTVAEISNVVLQKSQSSLISLLPADPPQVTVLQSSPAAWPNTLQVSVQYTFKGYVVGAVMQALGNPWVIHASTVMVHE